MNFIFLFLYRFPFQGLLVMKQGECESINKQMRVCMRKSALEHSLITEAVTKRVELIINGDL